jgi:hypothetical protein
MLALKMAATAAVVVTASLVAERVGALIGAMVATLPIAAGPAYILLALDHDARFIADSTVASLAVHAATGLFGTAYVFAAQRCSFAASIAIAVGTWFGCALAIRSTQWSLAGAIALCAATYGVRQHHVGPGGICLVRPRASPDRGAARRAAGAHDRASGVGRNQHDDLPAAALLARAGGVGNAAK